MSRPGSHSTTRPTNPTEPPADSFTDPPTPFDAGFGYRVTEEGMKALQEYEERHGKPALRRVPLPDTIAEALHDEAWRDRKSQLRKKAHQRGHRLVTVCGLNQSGSRIPDLRLKGQWLERAGFHPGRHCEIEVTPGTLTLRAL
jgi:hypothetical protein